MVQRLLCAAFCAAALAAAASPAAAQTIYPPPASQPQAPAGALRAADLDQLVSPIALYPDTLLAQVLAASTYPLDVVQAHRWISQSDNASLSGGALVQAVAAQGWDASVQALIPFPQVLQLMDEHLNWTEQLGETFLAQPQDVMNAVQRLRHRAQGAGTLKITPDQSVVNEGGDITIASAAGPDAYVPSYDPQCVYGPWPDYATAPDGFAPWDSACATPADDGIAYNPDYVPYGFFLWGDIDWRNHCIRIDRARYALANPGREPDGDVWRHDPAQRRGAPYRNRVNAQHFGRPAPMPEPFHYYDAAARDRVPHAQRAGFAPHVALAGPREAAPMRAPAAARPVMAPASAGHVMAGAHH